MNTDVQLEQEVELQSEFTSGHSVQAEHYSGERGAEGTEANWGRETQEGLQLSCIGAEIRN